MTDTSLAEPDADLLARLDLAVAEHAESAETLLVDLVAISSVNPLQPGVSAEEHLGGESAANALLAEWMSRAGAENHTVTGDRGRDNLVAVLPGSGGGRSLAVNGHIDTVASQDGWRTDPWTAVRTENRIYGLGTTDMKAAHAATWLAFRALSDVGIQLAGDLHLHSVIGEETMSHELGTTAVLEAGFVPDAVLIPEPTSYDDGALQVANTAAGNYLFSMTVRGRSTHWASRNLAIRAGGGGDAVGVNAIDKAFYIYSAMRQLEEQWAFTKRHPQFAPGAFIIHPGVLHADVGFPAAPYFPDRARFDYLLSFPPGDTSEAIRAEVEGHINAAAALDPWLAAHPIEFDWIDTWPPAYTDPQGDFSRVVMAARNEVVAGLGAPAMDAPRPNGAQSDASFYEARGVPALVCGPGNLQSAHAANEFVDRRLIPATARMILKTALRWST
ncbi:acetylornithine deacetylase [Agrococcus baldri]|uniref:Acetylornithine deacetylase n=1 Tax=Agrococcus baldri TaxID=153730 RepID=A0AA94HKH8_9MICO|nr:M20/M25/M40 family metallo-hydrolase [Agrococcus baldri]SFR99947.1 acetylornithine deacetylase [Agrococcus baldri]